MPRQADHQLSWSLQSTILSQKADAEVRGLYNRLWLGHGRFEAGVLRDLLPDAS